MSKKIFDPRTLRDLALHWNTIGTLDPAIAKKRTKKGAKHSVGETFKTNQAGRSPAEYRRRHLGNVAKARRKDRMEKQKARRAKKLATAKPISHQLKALLGEKQSPPSTPQGTSGELHSPTGSVD